MWEDAPPHIVNYLRGNAVSYNNHKKAVTPKVKINLINDIQLYQSHFNPLFFFSLVRHPVWLVLERMKLKGIWHNPFTLHVILLSRDLSFDTSIEELKEDSKNVQTFARRRKKFHTFHYGTITSDVSYIKISSQRLNAILSFFFNPRPFTRTNI